MTNEREEKLAELIDCCRRAEDLTLPELHELAAAVQADPAVDRRLKKSLRIDAIVGQSIRDVPIPDGLEKRLLASITANASQAETQQQDIATASAAGSSPETNVDLPSPATLSRTRLQGWKVWAAGLASVAAIVLIVVMTQSNRVRGPNTESEVAVEVSKWMNNLDKTAWSHELPMQDYPLPSQPRLSTPYTWQKVAKTSLNVACYNIPSRNRNTHILLFVCQGAGGKKLQSKPPAQPTAAPVPGLPDWVMGTWKSNDLIYALTVKGTPHQYQLLITGNSQIASL